MVVALLALGLLAGAPPSVGALWPCTPGLRLRYRVTKAGEDTGLRITDTVRGPLGRRLCVVDRRTEAPGRAAVEDAFVLERHEDQILYAGPEGSLTAFRPPVIRAPLEPGAAWIFNEVRYIVQAVDTKVETPAGAFEGCVRIRERSRVVGAHRGEVVYAPGIGPIVKVSGAARTVLERVSVAPPRPPESPSETGQ